MAQLRSATPAFWLALLAALVVAAALGLGGCATTAPAPAGPAPDPMPGADRLVVQLDMAPAEAYGHVVRTWAGLGYALAASDETARVVTTEFKETEGASRISLTAAVAPRGEGSEVTVRGRFNLGINVGQAVMGQAAAPDAPETVRNRGMGGSPLQVTFAEMVRAGRALGGTLLFVRD